MSYNPNIRCQKYIVVGRQLTIKNIGGADKIKLITEIFSQVKGTADSGMVEYKRIYYRELNGGRGVDTAEMDAGQSYISVDRTAHDFVDINYSGCESVETNKVLKFRTYKNRKFVTRNRATSFHEEINVGVDDNGNVTTKPTKGAI